METPMNAPFPVWLLSALAAAFATLASPAASAMTDAELGKTLAKRFAGDRTGACVAAAVLDERVATAFVCADPKSARKIDAHTTFEIGSVTKTMTALLLADLIERKALTLDTPLATLLPEDTAVPSYQGEPITLAHVVTHTSGLPALPSRAAITALDDPYAKITDAQLFGSLGDVTLSQAPGKTFAYSNFAMMVLSAGIVRHEKESLDTLLRERIFAPLGMDDAYLATPKDSTHVAIGHLPNGTKAGAWNFPDAMSGVGGVRASLTDMIRYTEAQLGKLKSSRDAAIALTQAPIVTASGRPMAMNWMIAPCGAHRCYAHGGATGGFSAEVVFDREGGRGVVLLSDTSLTSVGGLEALAFHLLDPTVPVAQARKAMPAPGELIDALVGRYQLQGAMGVALTREGNALFLQADGQPKFKMGYDSAGEFYPEAFDALLRPVRHADGTYDFVWSQGGAQIPAKRLDRQPAGDAPRIDAATLKSYEGVYPLAPTFSLTVSVRDGTLFVQGTNQGPIAVEPSAKDVFTAAIVGAEIAFERDADGKVIALTLRQAGQVLRGEQQ
jgi:D-alanyl-D-alanine-carboxypeptidase/D-alanyl-D-alanine-endopeptidase